MKPIALLLTVVTVFASLTHGQAGTELWTKDLEDVGKYSYWRVGSDGSVAIVKQKPNLNNSSFSELEAILWFARNGTVTASVSCSFTNVKGPVYVSGDELAVWAQTQPGNDYESRLEIFQINSSGGIDTTVVAGRGDTYTSYSLSFPYILNATVIEDNGDGSSDYRFTLIDLTNPNTLKVVGDAVIGVHGANLKVRWKTVANAKYKVQSSFDLEAWTDYTEIIDGNGATMIVNIPIDEHSASIYARVVKL